MSGTSFYEFGELASRYAAANSRVGILLDPDFQNQMTAALDALMPNGEPGAGVLSLDVFDTILLRNEMSELSRFLRIGALMFDEVGGSALSTCHSQIDGFFARYLGTRASYRATTEIDGCREGSLLEIHRISSLLMTGSESYAARFVALELEFEASTLSPALALIDYAKRHRQYGGTVIAISDTYLHTIHIEQLMEKCGIQSEIFAAIFSSADEKISKASGQLFQLAADRISRKTSEFVHVGDNPKGDLQMAAEAGCRTFFLPDGTPRKKDHLASLARIRRDYGLDLDIEAPAK